MSNQELRIYAFVERSLEQHPCEVALLTPEGKTITYQRLLAQIEKTVAALNSVGIGRRDRVAVVLPNGPQMAACFLAVASGTTCAPLNPAYRAQEFDFYLSDLKPSALIVEAGTDLPAVAVARSLGIRVLELSPGAEGEEGVFSLNISPAAPLPQPDLSGPGDVALVLHTSGTTSRPKIVPLTHANLCHSACSIAVTLELGESDRCLNVMPLFHIHGLVGAVLSSITAGASVVCTPGLQAPRFLQWLEELRPTWYTAVPTMHQTILTRAKIDGRVLQRSGLRFIRSSSSALPLRTLAELEEVFGVPVIESYGMTEASHQMSSNPLPPATRKPGSVGRPAGSEIAIMDSAGNLQEPGQQGEIVIRGPSVTGGYENNPESNESDFIKGWFRTGDEGYLDSNGYLFLAGRIKEIINRGGEKISPFEIEEALLGQPGVDQAVVFAVPDERLGEDVGAAVVLRNKATTEARELRARLSEKLAIFKVPRYLLFVEEIPKGPTGKLQRIGLAAELGLTGANGKSARLPGSVAPRTATEALLCQMFCMLLGLEQVGIHDNLFELGGDSILATGLCARLREAKAIEFPLVEIFDNPTAAGIAARVDAMVGAQESTPAPHSSGL